jgi:DNA-binding beta-propeller fold protein YncE
MYSSNGVYKDISSPTGLAADNTGNLFVAGFSDNTIYKIGPDNKKIVYIKSEKIDGPIGLALDSNGNIYIANYNKNNVLKVDKNGLITVLIENIANPYCLNISGDLLFVSSQGSNSVVRYKLTK